VSWPDPPSEREIHKSKILFLEEKKTFHLEPKQKEGNSDVEAFIKNK
jgi:hypothetical protein